MAEFREVSGQEVLEFLEKEISDIIFRIAEAYDSSKSSVEYEHFCEDGDLEIDSLEEADGHLCEVKAKGSVHVGYVASTQDGPWPDDYVCDVDVFFYVDLDENNNLVVSFKCLDDGSIDIESTVCDIEADDY